MSVTLANIFTEPGIIPASGFQIGATTFTLDPIATAGLVDPISGSISIDGNSGLVTYNETAAETAAGPKIFRAAMVATTTMGCQCSDPFVVAITVPGPVDPCAGLSASDYVGDGACPDLPSYNPAVHDIDLTGLDTGFTAPLFESVGCSQPPQGTTIGLGTVDTVSATVFRYNPVAAESGTNIGLCFSVTETSGGQTGCVVLLDVTLTIFDFCSVLLVNDVSIP